MRYSTRAFLLCFAPMAVLLPIGFQVVQQAVERSVVDQLRVSVRKNQTSILRAAARTDVQNSRFLSIAGENPALKAGIQLLLTYRNNPDARRTVEDQLTELGQRMGFGLLLVSNARGKPLAGVVRTNAQMVPLGVFDSNLPDSNLPSHGLFRLAGEIYQIASVPIDDGLENLGTLYVGEIFRLNDLNTPAVLTRSGSVIASSIAGIAPAEIQAALRSCREESECEVRAGGKLWISLPMPASFAGNGYELRTLQDIDGATAPLRPVLTRVFLIASAGTLVIALLLSLLSAQSIVKPLAAIVAHLREVEKTGMLPEFNGSISGIHEMRELTCSFNRAASAIRSARENLDRAYVEFVGSLASALDARDRYTAGHSTRVSELACATAAELGIAPDEIDNIRIGALLHDIGKIGIADRVLQKPGRLTDEEFTIVKQHPGIGRRILEGVQGFSRYLAAVEFHHENWDGSGYPAARRGSDTPVDARIIHVVDAYDAMTTDRPYRPGMTSERAEAILVQNAGTQFDPAVVDAFLKAIRSGKWDAQCEFAGAA